MKLAARIVLGLATATVAAPALIWADAAAHPHSPTTTECLTAFVRGERAELVWAQETSVNDLYTVVTATPSDGTLARLLTGMVSRHDSGRHQGLWIGIFDDYQVAMHVARVQGGNAAADWEVPNLDAHWVGEYSSKYLFPSGQVGTFAWESPGGKLAGRELTLKAASAGTCS